MNQTVTRTLKLLILASALMSVASCSTSKSYQITSPDGKISVTVGTDRHLCYNVTYNGENVVENSKIALVLEGGDTLGNHSSVRSVRSGEVQENIIAPFHRQAAFDVLYNKLTLKFAGDYAVEFRVYNEGCAYRFITMRKGQMTVMEEIAEFSFADKDTCWAAITQNVANAFQFPYTVTTVAAFGENDLALTPVAVALSSGTKVLVGESDLRSYPGMMLKRNEANGFKGTFACVPDSCYIHPKRCQMKIATRENYIAITEADRTFPWRILTIGKDTDLPLSNLVYALGEPVRLQDISWIKSGKAAWEWWNDWGLTGVDFTPGINTVTYKAYIDFAADFGLEYIVIDEGWSDPATGDIMSVIDGMDLKEIISYAKARNVGVFLWAVANVLDDKLEEAFRYYSDIGVKGFKVDFLDRDDQKAVEMVYRIAESAARYRLMVDLHGMYKPTGLERTFPNVLNFEGVFGMEEYKWANPDIITYDVTFPYIRMSQGPVDYTSGGYRNVFRDEFQIDYHSPMTNGTRSHQVATFVVFDQPLAMLCDSPSLYRADSGSTNIIAAIPSVWDDTRILGGTIGDYIVTARRLGDDWYVGGLTNWNARTVHVDFSFLEKESLYQAAIIKDIPGAPATAYQLSSETVSSDSGFDFELVSGGGFAIILKKNNQK